MDQISSTTRSLTTIGEEICHELGAKMVKDFQDANPNEEIGNYIGRDILEKILNQPNCMGIRFYNAINEIGRKTLVYVGVDNNNELISEYVGVNKAGELIREKGIVADRAGAGDKQFWDWWS